MINLRKMGLALVVPAMLGLWAAARNHTNHTSGRVGEWASGRIAPAAVSPTRPTASAPAGKLFAPTREQKSDALKSYNAMPIYFEPNQGQSNANHRHAEKMTRRYLFI